MQPHDDIVRALGFVALYAAYLEESVDVVMERLGLVEKLTDRERRYPISRKIEWCSNTIESLGSDELGQLIDLLQDAQSVLEKRNEVIHGRICPGNKRSEKLVSGRPNTPDREVTAEELSALAEELFELQAAVPNIDRFATMRAIAGKQNA